VIARTSVMHYRKSNAPLDQIARELGVAYVLEGSAVREARRRRGAVQMGHLYLQAGDRDRALEWLQRASEVRDPTGRTSARRRGPRAL